MGCSCSTTDDVPLTLSSLDLRIHSPPNNASGKCMSGHSYDACLGETLLLVNVLVTYTSHRDHGNDVVDFKILSSGVTLGSSLMPHNDGAKFCESTELHETLASLSTL